MASPPLIDLDAIDLSRVIASREDTLRLLKQRGRFSLLDGVLHRDEGRGLIVGFKDIRADEWWAADHIPGRPIFPGALMIETGAQLCSYDYLCRQDAESFPFIGFGGLNATRFRGLVVPGVRMLFVCKVNRIRRTMFTYLVQGLVEGKLVFETEVIGVVIRK